jgi:hypothetical protein
MEQIDALAEDLLRERDALPAWCLSLSQPWAWAILHANKRVENRKWRTRYRGPITLHAALSWDEDGWHWIRMRRDHRPPIRAELSRGCYVGTATLLHCWEYEALEERERREAEQAHPYSWAFGPYCFDLADVKPLATPIPAKGRLGIYRRPEVREEVCRALPAL